MADAMLVVKEYLHYLQGIKGVRKSSAKTYANKLGRYVRWLERDPMIATEKDIGDFMIYLKERKLGINTQRIFITTIKGFYKWAVEKRKRSGNPAKALRPLREFKKHPEIMRVEEVERMIVAAGSDNFLQMRNAAIIAVLADTGIRISELLALKVGNIVKDEKQFIMTVPATKASRNRMVPFCYLQEGSLVAEVWSQYWLSVKLMKGWTADEYLFQRETVWWLKREHGWVMGKERNFEPGPLTIYTVADMLKRVAAEAGVERNVTPHCFRHFYATYLAVNGVDIFKIKERLGHASLDRTQIYVHYADIVKADSSRNNPLAGSKAVAVGPVKLLKELDGKTSKL